MLPFPLIPVGGETLFPLNQQKQGNKTEELSDQVDNFSHSTLDQSIES